MLILHTKSEDLLTGNVFGILKNLNWSYGLKPFLESVTGKLYSRSEFENVEFRFWNRTPVLREGEGSTEVDLIIKSETTLFFVEAKYGAQASSGTTNEKERNQLGGIKVNNKIKWDLLVAHEKHGDRYFDIAKRPYLRGLVSNY